VVGREAHRRGVRAEIGQPQRPGVRDQLVQQSLALGQVTDPRHDLVVDAHMQEPREASVRRDHAQSPVAGVDERGGRPDDAVQRLVELQPLADRQHRIQQALQPVLGGHDLGDPLLHLAQQLVEPQACQQVREPASALTLRIRPGHARHAGTPARGLASQRGACPGAG
jgi:hypothetical protein